MKDISLYILEKLNIQSIDINKCSFTDKELLDDYEAARSSYTKAEKEPIANKYGVNSIRMHDIELAILDELRKNRFNKKEFDRQDITNFYRYEIGERYEKLKTYLDKEPKEFVEYLLEFLKEKAKAFNPRYLSPANKYTLKRISNLQKYLNHQ